MNKQILVVILICVDIVLSGCNGQQSADLKEQNDCREKDYQNALSDFATWRKFVEQPIDEITIINTDEDYYGKDGKKIKSQTFAPIKIKDPVIIKRFVLGISYAKYEILNNNLIGAAAGELPSFRIIYKSGKDEKSIWVCSFGYCINNSANLIYSRP